jgi:preprotein translocase SecE subunit
LAIGIVEEIKKIQWPKKDFVIYNSILVIISILISILVVTGIDYILTKGVNWYISLK